MRTNIDIDDGLMRQAMRCSGARTKKAAVEAGLRLLARRTLKAPSAACAGRYAGGRSLARRLSRRADQDRPPSVPSRAGGGWSLERASPQQPEAASTAAFLVRAPLHRIAWRIKPSSISMLYASTFLLMCKYLIFMCIGQRRIRPTRDIYSPKCQQPFVPILNLLPTQKASSRMTTPAASVPSFPAASKRVTKWYVETLRTASSRVQRTQSSANEENLCAHYEC